MTGKQAIENNAWIWERGRLDRQWTNRACIWGIRSAHLWELNIVETTVRLSVSEFISKMALGRMFEAIPELPNKSIRKIRTSF